MDRLPTESSGAPHAGAPEDSGRTLADLLRRSARGDHQAFAELYDEVSARVYGLALRIVRDPAQAEEVAQEALLDVWRTSSRFDPDRGSAVSWILTITHRRAIDRVRAAEAATNREVAYEQRNITVPHDSTADAVHASLEARRVRTALEGLTPTQREAIDLAYFGGYTHTEVAAILDLPVGTAKTRIRDGLIRLRDRWGVGS